MDILVSIGFGFLVAYMSIAIIFFLVMLFTDHGDGPYAN